MKSTHTYRRAALAALAALMAAAGLGAGALAQERAESPESAPDEPAQSAEHGSAALVPEDLARQLAEARRRLDEAARDVARLSAQRIAPELDDVQRALFLARRINLGLNIQDAEDGVHVVGVSPNGPAAEAGVQIGDLIVAIDDVDLATEGRGAPTQRLLGRLVEVQPGEQVELTLVRDGSERTVAVEAQSTDAFAAIQAEVEEQNRAHQARLRAFQEEAELEGQLRAQQARERALEAEREGQARRQAQAEQQFASLDELLRLVESGRARDDRWGQMAALDLMAAGPMRARLADRWRGLEMVELTAELGAYFGTEEGLLVVRAPEDEALGLRDGDVIMAIGERAPASPEHAMRILRTYEAGEVLELTVQRQHQRETLEVELAQSEEPRVLRAR